MGKRTNKVAVAGLALGLTVIGAAPPAWGGARQAKPAQVIAGSSEVELTEADKAHTGSVTLTGTSDAAVTVGVASPQSFKDPDCAVTLGDDETVTIKPGIPTKVAIKLSSQCELPDGGRNLELTAGDQTLTLTLKPKSVGDPQWHPLLASFLAALIAAIILVLVAFVKWRPKHLSDDQRIEAATAKAKASAEAKGDPPPTAPPTLGEATELCPKDADPADEANEGADESWSEKWKAELPSIGTDWKFKDSWASNLTVLSAAFAAILGASDVLKALIGSDADETVAVALVASVMAALLVALGPILVLVCGKKRNKVTAGGLVAGGIATLTGAAGQIGTLTWLGSDLDIGDKGKAVIVGGGALTLLVLGIYAYKSTMQNLREGGVGPTSTESDAVLAGKRIAAAILALEKGDGSEATAADTAARVNTIMAAFPRTSSLGSYGTSPGDDPHYSAIL